MPRKARVLYGRLTRLKPEKLKDEGTHSSSSVLLSRCPQCSRFLVRQEMNPLIVPKSGKYSSDTEFLGHQRPGQPSQTCV